MPIVQTNRKYIYYMSDAKIMTGSTPAAKKYRITIAERGPYLVFGRPPLAQQFIMSNDRGASWYFQEGRHFSTESEPTALCRCGASHRKPYCDGTHASVVWDSELKAPVSPLLEAVEVTEGPKVSMSDNERYCTFARFCDADGRAWALVAESDDPRKRKLAIREASMCPGSRLMAWDNETGKPFEPHYDPELALIEDIAMNSSGGLWVRGGIRIERADGTPYEIRNRVVLCRCGLSENKPYCDGTHAAIKWRDEIEGVPEGETVPEKVY